ncbi:MAG: BatD family protein [Chitinophagaceae bacterium]
MTVVPQVPITVGESFQVQYIIEDGEKVSNFKPATFKNFRIVAGPNIYMGSVTKGNEIKQLKNLVYTLEAIKPGYFLIEGATILINGKPARSNDVMVRIISREDAAKRLNGEMTDINSDYFLRPGEDAYEKIRNNLFLKMTVNKKTCFVGEPILATFKLYSRLESRSDIIKNPGFYGFTVYDMINLADKEMVTEYVKGKLFDVHTLRKVQLYPLQEGVFTIDAMEVKNSVEFSHTAVNKKTEQEIVEGMLRNDSNEVKDNNTEVFESTIGTEPVVIKVKPAPVKSKPASFSGATGAFNIIASVEKKALNKNEEGLLEITISGKGNFIQLNAPAIEWPEGMEGFEPVVNDMLDKTQTPLSGSRTFQYGFISAKPGSYTIPSIHFSFFDPDSGKYKTIISRDMQIMVSNEELLKEPIVTAPQKTGRQQKKYWLIGTAALLLCFATGYWFLIRKRNKKTEIIRDNKIDDPGLLSVNEILPASLLLSSLKDADFYRSLHLSIWRFFNHYFHLSGSEMNKENLLVKLRDSGINERAVADTLHILQECENGMFTNASLTNNKEKLIEKTRKLFEEINPELSSRPSGS